MLKSIVVLSIALAASLQQGIVEEPAVMDAVSEQIAVVAARPVDYGTVFARDCFIGDSITGGLSYYGLLREEQVISHLGFTLGKAATELDWVRENQPENIYLLFGANDLGPNVSDETFVENYRALITALHAAAPQARIFAQSVMPVTTREAKSRPYLSAGRLDELNRSLYQMTLEEEANYVNIRKVLQIHADEDLYEPDGLHFRSLFDRYWLDYLMEQTKKNRED
ncbi:MAG: GDSL-type esterase/lipase family protein [Gracilibacteraceae bacterium]|jgi:hypothetical protein|nr:GDSL-type esterase/lipase family protein [Gracilibacteraceae bacterium]